MLNLNLVMIEVSSASYTKKHQEHILLLIKMCVLTIDLVRQSLFTKEKMQLKNLLKQF